MLGTIMGGFMKYIFQFARIMGFCLAGELLHRVLPLPIPAGIYGLVLLAAALLTGIVKLEQVKQTGDFLTSIFPLLFVPTVAGVMEAWDLIAGNLIPIAIALVPITWLVMAVAGRVTQIIMDRRARND
jgi:holin-like protein